jgi:hypothetical protein
MTESQTEQKEQAKDQLRLEFKTLVLEGGEVTRERAARAFSITQRFSSAVGVKNNFHADVIIDSLLYNDPIDPTTAALGKTEFDFNTVGQSSRQDTSKGVLKGLSGDELELALQFCTDVSTIYESLFK